MKSYLKALLAAVFCVVGAHGVFANEYRCNLGQEVPRSIQIGGAVMIVFEGTQCFGMYEDGQLASREGRQVFGYASTGGAEYPTPLSNPMTGADKVLVRDIDHISKEYPVNADGTRGGARMRYAQFIDPARGIAIHAGYVRNEHASHGCIRVSAEAARLLYEEFDPFAVIVTQDTGSLRVLWENQ